MAFSFKDLKISNKLYVGFGLLIVLIVIVSLISFNNSNTLIEDTGWIIHTNEVLVNIDGY
tara:strand:- start:5072 stop:5251 length:180 start_codon:yes stop_codon:yes gene_type:complete